jgi:non-ribosomal peptide synthetase component F
MSNSLALTAAPIASSTESSALPLHIKRVFPSDRSIPQLISQQARENPSHIALGDASIRLTYGELDDRANQLAHCLKELGVGTNTAVAVCVRRSPLAALASLAVMKAGAA